MFAWSERGRGAEKELGSVRLRGAFNGVYYAHAGVGHEANGWAVPCAKFKIQDIVGRPLIEIEPVQFKLKRDTQGKPIQSEGFVDALIDTHGKSNTYGEMAQIADDDKIVLVSFGKKECMKGIMKKLRRLAPLIFCFQSM